MYAEPLSLIIATKDSPTRKRPLIPATFQRAARHSKVAAPFSRRFTLRKVAMTARGLPLAHGEKDVEQEELAVGADGQGPAMMLRKGLHRFHAEAVVCGVGLS